MVEETRPPVAIRSMRPYSTEEAFLAEERDTLTRTAVTLIGAPTRPRGVIIRFEVTLSDGTPIVRGEGRVLGFQPADEHGPSSLTLRFTRLDAKSKALVDRAATLRESDASPTNELSATTLPPSSAPSSEDDPLASTMVGSTLSDTSEPSEEPIALAISSGNLPLIEADEIGIAGPGFLDPSSRDVFLDRLRVRAKTLSPAQIATILTARRRSS